MRNAFLRQNRTEIFRADHILGQKLTRLRLALARRIEDKERKFSEEELKAFIENVRGCAKDQKFFDREAGNVLLAVKNREAPRTPDLSLPELQLLWAAAVHYLDRNNEVERSNGYIMGHTWKSRVEVTATKLWEQLLESPHARGVLYNHAIYISEELHRPDTRFAWSAPGTGVKYDRDQNTINVDFLQSLVAGMEHAHSVMFREIGKSQLSTMFPEKNRKIREQMVALREKQEQGKLSDAEYKKLRRLGLEWEMRKMLWESAERCTTNRYTERKGQEKAQDYAYSLNHHLMSSTHFGRNALENFREQQRERERMKKMAKEALDELKDQLGEQAKNLPPEMRKMFEQQVRQLENMVTGTPEQRFINILNAIELSFFRNNGLFDHNRENWERFGIDVDAIKITKEGERSDIANDATGKDGFPPPDFRQLLDMCGGLKGLENMQPRPRDRWQGKTYFKGLTDSYAEKRNELIEKIWDLYIDDIAKELLKNLDQQLDEELGNEPQQGQDQQSDQQNNQQQQKGQQGQQGNQQDPSGQQQNDQKNGQQDGQQQNQQGQQQKGDQNQQQNNQKGDQSQDGQQNQNRQDQQGQDQQGQDQQGQGGQEDGQEGQSQNSQQKGQDGQQDGQDGQQQGQDGQQQSQQGQQSGQQSQRQGQQQDYGPNEKPFGENESGRSEGQGQDGQQGQQGQRGQQQGREFDPSQAGTDQSGKKVDVTNDKGQDKKMPDVDLPPENPEGQDPSQDANGQDADGQGQDQQGADGKTLEQIRKEIEEALKKMQEEAQQGQDGQDGRDGQGQEGQGEGQGQGQDGGDADSKSASSGAGDGGKPKTLEDIATMQWKSYPAVLAQLKSYVAQTARLLEQIRDRQLEKTVKRSPELEMLPEGREMDRFNREAHQNLITKKVTGQELEKEDLHRFHKDEKDQKPTTIDIVLLIDGSGSMTMDGYKVGKAKPMEIALLSSIILYEAAKKVDANVYIALWGNEDPIILAKPGDDPRDVERNILKAKSGMNCGTNLAPSIKKITKVLSEHKSSQYSGYTHMMVISDGDISDPEPAQKAINTLLSTTEYATLEFAVLKEKNEEKSAMENVAEKLKIANPTQKIGIHRDGDPNSIPAGIVGLIFQKIRMLESFTAVPWARKRKLFQRANIKFDMK